MISKTTELEIRKGKHDLKLAYKGSRPSTGAVATVPLRDGYEAGAYATAIYIESGPAMHQLLCDLNDYLHSHARHDISCMTFESGLCSCGLDDLLIRLVNQVEKLERANNHHKTKT